MGQSHPFDRATGREILPPPPEAPAPARHRRPERYHSELCKPLKALELQRPSAMDHARSRGALSHRASRRQGCRSVADYSPFHGKCHPQALDVCRRRSAGTRGPHRRSHMPSWRGRGCGRPRRLTTDHLDLSLPTASDCHARQRRPEKCGVPSRVLSVQGHESVEVAAIEMLNGGLPSSTRSGVVDSSDITAASIPDCCSGSQASAW